MSSTPVLWPCRLDRLASLASGCPPPACLALSPAPPSCRVVCRPACLVLSIIPPPRFIQYPLATQVIYLDLIVMFIIPVECGCDEGPADGLAGRFISGHRWNTKTIMSMWMRQSSPPPTNLFINMLGIVPVNSSQLFRCVGKLFCVSQLCFDKNGHKKNDEVQIWLALAMMCQLYTKGVVYQSDQIRMTKMTAHSNG
jgi:hypothetical protein